MSATLRITHKTIGAEVRRSDYEIIVDGSVAGSVAMNASTDIPLEPGVHTLELKSGRNSSRVVQFAIIDGQRIEYRCTGKSFLPVFLASFVKPSLALHLRRVNGERTL